MEKLVLRNAVNVSHLIVKSIIKEGDKAIDATCGKGNDTLFLAKLVGETGKVYAFDIQEKAISATYKKLAKNDMLSRVELILADHAYIDKHIKEPVDVVMFNLGFLPGSNHQIITKANTTVQALERVLPLLKNGGIITIIVYTGHEGGKEELQTVSNYLKNLSQSEYEVSHLTFINQINNPPQLIVVQRCNGGRQ